MKIEVKKLTRKGYEYNPYFATIGNVSFILSSEELKIIPIYKNMKQKD